MKYPEKQPYAHVAYVCSSCGYTHKNYELYAKQERAKKYCSSCRIIRTHIKVLPDDDEIKNYRKPLI